MNQNEAIHILESFFKGNSPFEETKEMFGQESSRIPNVFIGWLARQQDEDKRVIVVALADSIIAGNKLNEHFSEACYLMVMVADQHPSLIPKTIVTKVERLFRKGKMIKAWLDDVETEDDAGKDSRLCWRFALILWNLLMTADSPVAEEAFQIFAKEAKDPHFVRSIKLAKKVSRGRDKSELDWVNNALLTG